MTNLDFLSAYDYTVENEDVIIKLNANETKMSFLKNLLEKDIELSMFTDYRPSLQEIFIEKAGDQNEAV